MIITTKELRTRPGKIIDQVANGQEVTVTFRGKPLARIVPFKKRLKEVENGETTIFGLWSDHADSANVENYIRGLRKGRTI